MHLVNYLYIHSSPSTKVEKYLCKNHIAEKIVNLILKIHGTESKPTCIIWWQIFLENTAMLIFPRKTKSHLLKGAPESETISNDWKPFKNNEKCFLFHLASFSRSQDI